MASYAPDIDSNDVMLLCYLLIGHIKDWSPFGFWEWVWVIWVQARMFFKPLRDGNFFLKIMSIHGNFSPFDILLLTH